MNYVKFAETEPSSKRPVFSLLYVSSAVKLFSDDDLIQLMEVSRRNNRKVGVTGMLLYRDGNFMQFIEGDKVEVMKVAQRIEADPRHSGMIRLFEHETAEREFLEWAMGFKRLEGGAEPAGYTDFLDLPLTSDEFIKNPSKCMKLLLSFKNRMR